MTASGERAHQDADPVEGEAGSGLVQPSKPHVAPGPDHEGADRQPEQAAPELRVADHAVLPCRTQPGFSPAASSLESHAARLGALSDFLASAQRGRSSCAACSLTMLAHEPGVVRGVHVARAPCRTSSSVAMTAGSSIAVLKASCSFLHDRRVHALGTGEAEGGIEHEGIAELLERRRVGPGLAALLRSRCTSRRTWPASTSGFQPVHARPQPSTCPPSTAALVSAPPLKGTWVQLDAGLVRRSAPCRCAARCRRPACRR